MLLTQRRAEKWEETVVPDPGLCLTEVDLELQLESFARGQMRGRREGPTVVGRGREAG